VTLGDLSQEINNEDKQPIIPKQGIITQANNRNDLISPNFSSFTSQLSNDGSSMWSKYNAGYNQYLKANQAFNSVLGL